MSKARNQAPSKPVCYPVVRFSTSKGTIDLELFTDVMPVTTSNFLDLVESHFYDGLYVHRVQFGAFIQFGCPLSKEDPFGKSVGTGSAPGNSSFQLVVVGGGGGEMLRSLAGKIPDETGSAKISNEPFTLAMAGTGSSNSGGSQVFINTAHNTHLDFFNPQTPSSHVVFGKVVNGQMVVREIEGAKISKTIKERPDPAIKIIKAEILSKDFSI